MLKEFREFAMRGNVVDLAVGIILGTAFTAIVNSLVNDIIMPPIGYVLGGVDFSAIAISLGTNEAGEAVSINIGLFINALISFVIIAFAVFMLVRTMNRLAAIGHSEDAPEADPPAEPSTEEKLLAAIERLNDTLDRMNNA